MSGRNPYLESVKEEWLRSPTRIGQIATVVIWKNFVSKMRDAKREEQFPFATEEQRLHALRVLERVYQQIILGGRQDAKR